ncbi:MAG: phosphoenolpyruvate hydrolase family protein [Firmicutes bacterium]|nr:phosphoenolpyruvate hydrolase family protein [Bacillota bacterium]
MTRKYTRKQVTERLRAQIEKGRPLLMFGAGIGLTAKCAEQGGADLIGIYSTGKLRMMGLPSLMAWLPYGDANHHLLEMAHDMLPIVKDTPCIAGIGAHDPLLDVGALLDKVMEMGFAGITNEPFVGLYGSWFAEQLEAAGIGFSREVDLIAAAHARDIFTVAWVFTPEEARAMAKAGADVIGAMIGVTVGGMSGASQSMGLEEATRQVKSILEAAREVNPGVIVLTHGGPFKDVETAEYSIIHSGADGYAAGSSGERLPTESSVVALTKKYKEMRLR